MNPFEYEQDARILPKPRRLIKLIGGPHDGETLSIDANSVIVIVRETPKQIPDSIDDLADMELPMLGIYEQSENTNEFRIKAETTE